MVIEVPEELKEFGEVMQRTLAMVVKARGATVGSKALDYAEMERTLSEQCGALEREGHRVILQALDIDRKQVEIGGQRHTRVGRSEATYYTMAGPVAISRALYRCDGKRNAKVVDPVSLRAGVVEGGWLPRTARVMGHLVQQGTSREAEETARQMGRLPYSRSSFERVAHELGGLYVAAHADIEDALIAACVVPAAAHSVSVSLDRVAVAIEEPRARKAGRPSEGAAKKPVTRAWRMAYCATVTLHDLEGEALHTIRYGRMPLGNVATLCEAVAGDVFALLQKRPSLAVTTLADGAAEMQDLLAAYISTERLGVHVVHHLVDFWHVIEKLGQAAQLLYGAAAAHPVVQRWKLLLCNSDHAVSRILGELERSGKRNVRIGKTRPVHAAITYLENNRECMGYAPARRLGLPIGSGNVEATCKSLVQIRMRRPGSRWKHSTGEHIIQLRALALSDRWDPAMELTLRPLRHAVRAA
jgi:hypothetical protein